MWLAENPSVLADRKKLIFSADVLLAPFVRGLFARAICSPVFIAYAVQSLPINDAGRERCALSVGQFRPEKDHALQVRALAALRKISSKPKKSGGSDASQANMFGDSNLTPSQSDLTTKPEETKVTPVFGKRLTIILKTYVK